jgi:ATP-binding cassette subfamily B protein RaxB
MTIGLLIMLTLYGGWLVWVVVGFTLCYAIMRLATYRFYRRVAEEQVIKGARSSSHFMESLYGISTIKALNLKSAVRSIGLILTLMHVMQELNKLALI